MRNVRTRWFGQSVKGCVEDGSGDDFHVRIVRVKPFLQCLIQPILFYR